MTEKNELLSLCSEKGPCTLDNETFEQCAVFLFYTSWFEERLFNKSKQQNPTRSRKICNDLTPLINLQAYDDFGQFCINRYIDNNGNETSYFSNLGLNPSNADIIKTSLRGFTPGGPYPQDTLWSYLQIVYRYRNNMFHGNKGLSNLRNFVEEFRFINRFMHQFIRDIIDSGYKGFNS